MSYDTKSKELLYRISLKPEFQEDIRKLRVKYKIPTKGFPTDEQPDSWTNYFFKNRDQYFKDEKSLLKKHKLAATLAELTRDYLILGHIQDIDPRVTKEIGFGYPYFSCEINSPLDKPSPESRWKDSGLKYTQLLIHEQASKNDVKEYIDANWNSIRFSMFPDGVLPKTERVRLPTKRDRDEKIFSVWQQIINKKIKRIGSYIDIQISGIMRDQYGITVSEDNVRKIIQRQRKQHGL